VSGSLQEIALSDIVKILQEGHKSGAIHLSSDGESGSVYLQDGVIVDAEWKGLRGEEAFYAIVCVTQGDFTTDPTPPTRERRIHASPEALLSEGLRRLGEAGR
jgi:hypothetical protein